MLPTIVGLLAALMLAYHLFPAPVCRALIALQRRVAGLRSHRLVVDDHTLHYLEGGSGDTLLLIHGFGADCDAWAPMAASLTSQYHVVAPDLPGFGDSSRVPSASYTLDDQLGRLEAFITHLGLTRFHLAGNSMGGYLAAHYAARHPGQVRTLWLLAPAGVATAEESELQQMIAGGDNPLLVRTPADFQRIIRMVVATPRYLPGAVTRTLAARAIMDCDFHGRLFEQLSATAIPLEEALKGVTVPTLIQWGDKDRLLHVSGAAILHALLPGSTLQVMPNIGHVPMQEAPRDAAQAFMVFQVGTESRATTPAPTSRK